MPEKKEKEFQCFSAFGPTNGISVSSTRHFNRWLLLIHVVEKRRVVVEFIPAASFGSVVIYSYTSSA